MSSPRAGESQPKAAAPEMKATEPETSAKAAPKEDAAPPVAAAAPPPIPKNTAVLHIGDSFTLAGFSQSLRPRMKALGVRYEVRAETSSYTTSWASKMERLVSDMQPDLIIINLGANEVANTNPPAHAYAVRGIVRAIGGRPCVWVSPPLWRKDTGMIDVIRANSAPCRFYDSDKLVGQPIPRQGDKIHPSDKGGAIWADAFWSWLEAERTGASEGVERASPWALKPAPAEEHQPLQPIGPEPPR
jgi:lysophospholipase L1-like esterase